MRLLLVLPQTPSDGAELDNMVNTVPFSTVGNGLWEMDKWEMGSGWLRWLGGFRVRKFLISWEIEHFEENGGMTAY